MIAEYEGALLLFFHSAIPALNKMIYAEDIDLLAKISSSIQYPSLFYSREPLDWAMPKMLREYQSATPDSNGNLTSNSIFPFMQVYKAKVVMEAQSELMAAANSLRFFWNRNSYINVDCTSTIGDTIKVELRLLYIKIGTEMNNLDPKGARRVMEFSWQSQLFMSNNETIPATQGYEIIINGSGNLEIINLG